MTLVSIPVVKNGIESEPFFVCKRKDSIAVIAKNEKILLVWQHRFACNKYGWEIPQGAIEEGETPESGMLRELKEEVGYTSDSIQYIGTTYEAADWCTAKTIVLYAEKLKKISELHELEYRWFNIMEIKKLIQEQQIFDATTLAALQLYLLK